MPLAELWLSKLRLQNLFLPVGVGAVKEPITFGDLSPKNAYVWYVFDMYWGFKMNQNFMETDSKSLPWPPTPKTVFDFYWTAGLSTRKIGKIFGKSHETIRCYMDNYGIQKRNATEAAILANTKYGKTPFAGDFKTKAYLLGFRTGDLAARWSRRCVELSTSTTHQAMIKLFDELFSKYGRVIIRPRYHTKLGSYFWALNAKLDCTFHFLINKLNNVPSWISRNAILFMYFLAGYFDAEGCIYLYKHANNAAACLQIGSTDLNLLRDIRNTTNELGYHFKLTLSIPRGCNRKGYGKSNKDYWYLKLYRNDETISLLKRLPLLHEEKLAKRELALLIRGKRWSNVENLVKDLKTEIKAETVNCCLLAENAHRVKHASHS